MTAAMSESVRWVPAVDCNAETRRSPAIDIKPEGVHEYARQHRWPPAYAEGYLAGASIRRRGETLSRYAIVGIDDYSLGMRAGYFVRSDGAGVPAERRS